MSEYFHFRGYDIPVDLLNKTGGGTDKFEEVSDWHIAQVQKHICINDTDSVVEIGCGIGRDAIPLTGLLSRGSYVGTDTIGPSIRWCAENISPRHENFTFVHHDIHDTLHNPKGTLRAVDIRLPSEDESVDLILLHSVFTHMMEDEIVHYVGEFRRIMKPSGRVWASCFLVNDALLSAIRSSDQPGWSLRFSHKHAEGCYINRKEEPRQTVAYDENRFYEIMRRGGLVVDRTLWGAWSKLRAMPESGQDAVILRMP